MDNDFSQIVIFHRKQARLTQSELAKLAGIGKTTVFDIERGKRSVQFQSLLKVLEVLNIQLSWSSPLMQNYHALVASGKINAK